MRGDIHRLWYCATAVGESAAGVPALHRPLFPGNQDVVDLASLQPAATKRGAAAKAPPAPAKAKQEKTKASPAPPSWRVGAACRCIYVEDGHTVRCVSISALLLTVAFWTPRQYAATVESIDSAAQTCTVRFDEGHRQFETPLFELQPPLHAAAPTAAAPAWQPQPQQFPQGAEPFMPFCMGSGAPSQPPPQPQPRPQQFPQGAEPFMPVGMGLPMPPTGKMQPTMPVPTISDRPFF